MSELEPITREELLLNSIAGEGSSEIEPITRQEHYLSAIAGESDLPEGMEPITREEIYYQKILDNGGAGGGGDEPTGTKTININANGTTSHNVKAYATAQIITNVPNPSTGTKQINQNGTHDVTDFASAEVNVPNSYSSSDEGKVVSNGALTAQTSRQVTANGTYDTTLNSSVEVNVPSSGITPTGTKNITTNGDHDVTNFATAHVDVPTGITPSGSQTFTENGTYDVTNLAEAVVDVASSGGGSDRIPVFGNFALGSTSGNAEKIAELGYVVKLDIVTNATSPTTLNCLITSNLLGDETYVLDLKGNNVKIDISSFNTSNSVSALEKITCDDDPNFRFVFSGAPAQVFRGCSLLTEIRPSFDFSGVTGALSRWTDNNGLAALTYIRGVPNTLQYSLPLSTASLLSDASLISLANALKTGTSATLTLHATAKANCGNITGNVQSVTEDGVTYDFFVADSSGSTTLTDFITTTKGWTLA